MSRYIPPNGGPTRVDPGDLDRSQRKALRRLAATKPKPCGCLSANLCPQHIQALPAAERRAHQRRQRQPTKDTR